MNFAEKPEIAWRYANDLGSGGRGRKKWSDIRVEDLDSGDNFTYDPDTKLWKSAKESFAHEEFQDMMESGERYFEAYPKDAHVRAGKVDMREILDTYPDHSKPYYSQANKKGLEEFLDVVDSKKITNTVNPQHELYSRRIVDRLRQSAIDELKNVPGAPGFGNTFWGTTKWAKADETNEALKGVVGQLKEAGKEGIRFADDSHSTIATFKPPEKLVTVFKRISKPVMSGLAVVGALSASDMAQAAADVFVPGGVESMGVSDEQKKLDQEYQRKIYQEKVKSRQEKLNSLVKPSV